MFRNYTFISLLLLLMTYSCQNETQQVVSPDSLKEGDCSVFLSFHHTNYIFYFSVDSDSFYLKKVTDQSDSSGVRVFLSKKEYLSFWELVSSKLTASSLQKMSNTEMPNNRISYRFKKKNISIYSDFFFDKLETNHSDFLNWLKRIESNYKNIDDFIEFTSRKQQ